MRPLCGITPADERQRVLVVDDFLRADKVGQGVVACPVDESDSLSPSISQAAGECPSVLHHAGVVGVHQSGVVVAVGTGNAGPLSCGEARRPEVVVVGSSHTRHGVVVVLEGQRRLLRACLVVESSHEGVAEFAAFGIVHGVAVDVHVVVLRSECAVLEAGRREPVSHLAGIDITVGRDDGDVLCHVVVLSQLCLGEGECLLCLHVQGQ